MKLVSGLIVFYAAVLLFAGVALLFAPEIGLSGMSEGEALPRVLAQLLGAACLGFAAANWTTRHAIVGGIYGRAVVVGNQVFASIGVLVLLGNLSAAWSSAFWAFLIIFAFGAGLYGVLLYRPSWLTGASGEVDARGR